jgi:CBS domain-containing protein
MENGHLAGIITETDVLKLLDVDGPSDDLWLPSPLEIIELPIREFVNWEKTKKALTDIGAIPARDIMKHPVITVTPDMDVERAAEIMLNHSINRLVVTDKDQVVGILTRQDIVWSVGK